jgi:ABC-2 type transport system ATP-binding protein
MTAMTAAITVRDLHKRYGDTRAVDGVDLDVEAGQVVCLLGPNGAGKTTTIEILEGHRPRDSGEVSVLGVDPGHANEAFRTRIGIVAQSQAGTFAELTVREIVSHFATFYPDARDPDEAIALVGLAEKAGSRLRQLSA